MAIPVTPNPTAQQQPQTPAPATNAPATSAVPVAMTPEQRRKAEEDSAKLMNMLNNSPIGPLLRALGLMGPAAAADPSAKPDHGVFKEMMSKITVITPEDEASGYKQYDGKAETVEHNFRLSLQKKFDANGFVFDSDPVKNKAEFDLFMKDVGAFVKAGVPADGKYNEQDIMRAATARMKELGVDVVVRMENKLPTPVAKVQGADITYGEKLPVDAKNPASVAAMGLKDNKIDVNSMGSGGQLVSQGTLSVEELQKILGDKFTVQAYNHKHDDPVDLPKGAKPPIDGYYVSNDKGVGFYIGMGEISAATTKVDLSLTPERVAGATPTPAPAPLPQQPTVAAPTAGG